MSRQAFEAWVRTVDKSLSLHKVPDGGYKYPRTKSAWSAYKAATNAALARAEKACEAIENERWALYKGRPPYTGTEQGRADNYVQGESDGAGLCADAIRAMKDEK